MIIDRTLRGAVGVGMGEDTVRIPDSEKQDAELCAQVQGISCGTAHPRDSCAVGMDAC